MGMFSRRRPTRQYRSSGDALTAAAQQMAPTPEGEPKPKARKPTARQERAWEHYHEIGEARFASRYMGDAFARVRLFAGITPDPFSPPVPLDPAGDPELGYTAQEAAAAIERTETLWSPMGGQSEIKRR